MKPDTKDGVGSPLPSSDSTPNLGGDQHGGVPERPDDAATGKASSDASAPLDVTDPTAPASKESLPLESPADAHDTPTSVPDATGALPKSPTSNNDAGDTVPHQGESCVDGSSIDNVKPTVSDPRDGDAQPNEAIHNEKEGPGDTNDSSLPEPPAANNLDIMDDEKSTDASSVEASSSELSTGAASTDASSAESDPNSECGEGSPAKEEPPKDSNTPATLNSKPPPRTRRRRCRPSNRRWQDTPFPDTIADVYSWEASKVKEDEEEKVKEPEKIEEIHWADESLLDYEDPEKVDDNSASRKEWLRQKREENQQNEYLDQIMQMVGHEDVKAHFLYVKDRLEVAKRWEEDLSQLKFDLILHGNHGTGKKQIAQIYAKFMHSIGYISGCNFKCTRDDCIHDEQQSADAILFSKADDICQAHSIDLILEKMDKKSTNTVLIFPYTKLKSDSIKAFQSSPDARRRFPEPIRLNDYNDEELTQLLIRIIKKTPWGVEGGLNADNIILRTVARRAARNRGTDSFSNIRALKAELDAVCERQALRADKEWIQLTKDHCPDQNDGAGKRLVEELKQRPKIITQDDVLGPKPTDSRNKSKAWAEIQKMVGLERVKKEIGHLFGQATANFNRALQGKEPLKVNLNRVFLGPPGVGKTTVARLYGQIITELGLVSKGGVIMKTPNNLIGRHVGKSEERTKTVLAEAMGKVLIIDDAHMLFRSNGSGSNRSDAYRQAVIDTLVTQISGSPGEDRCVILAGYPDQMEDMFLNSNPGLQRRFPMEDALHFDTYSKDQLCDILQMKSAREETTISEHGRRVAREVLGRMRTRPGFGNGGDVEILLARARLRQRERLEASSIDRFSMEELPLEPEDFDEDYDRASKANEHRNSLFEGFVGFENIIEQFKGYQLMADGMRRCNIDPRPHIPWAFVFKGPPGTGKTSTARKIGRLFYDMGLLSCDKVITCSVTDFIGQYCGQTGPKVINQFEKAVGKVLFVDEAYRLNPGATGGSSKFTSEAIGEIVDAMTKPRYAGNMVVILAGYTSDMDKLLDSNQGLRSRFPTHITFPHMEPYQCFDHLKYQLRKLQIEIREDPDQPDDGRRKILGMFRKLSISQGWANGRDVETLANTIIDDVFMKVGQAGGDAGQGQSLGISTSELLGFMQLMLQERRRLGDPGWNKDEHDDD